MNILKKFARCFKAARHEWKFGGPDEYRDLNSQQPFRITALTGKQMEYGGMSPPYYGEEVPSASKNPLILKKHAIDKYGRVRYFAEIEDGYIDVVENLRIHDPENIVRIYSQKQFLWDPKLADYPNE